MNDTPGKYASFTSFLYDVAFDAREDEHEEVCLDCLNHPQPWQALRSSQNHLDELIADVTNRDRKAERRLETLKLQLFVLTSPEQRMAIYSELYFLVEQLTPLRKEIRSLDGTIKRLKRINHNQSELLKRLKVDLIAAKGECSQLELKQHIADTELELMSLWQRCIGAELEKLSLMRQLMDCKQQAVSVLDKHLDRFCGSSVKAQ